MDDPVRVDGAQHAATGDDSFKVDPEIAMLSIDALGFRRGAGALATMLSENGLEDDELFSQAKLRGIRSLAGHAETTDVTNDVNGGPSGIGIATASGKAMFWDFVQAPDSLKVIALEGEFAMTEGHAQELKTSALSQRWASDFASCSPTTTPASMTALSVELSIQSLMLTTWSVNGFRMAGTCFRSTTETTSIR